MSATVLVVDSEQEVLDTVQDMIVNKYPGTDVLQAHNGEEAIDLMGRHAHHVDAVFLSTDMPITDGWETLYVLKDPDNWPSTPVVMVVTEQTIWDDALKAHTIGAEHFVSRPIKPLEVFPLLDELLETESA